MRTVRLDPIRPSAPVCETLKEKTIEKDGQDFKARRVAKSAKEDTIVKALRWKMSAALPWLIPGAVFAQRPHYEWGWEHPMRWMWGSWGIAMGLLMLLFWGAVIVGIVVGIRWLINRGKASPTDTALDILRQRYARGEINKEEFEAKKRDLS
jgi:putative membrane protein